MKFCVCYLLQKPKAPETFVEAALTGQRDALRDPVTRCAMGLPIQSGTGGQFTLLPNPRMDRRGVPQEHLAERRLPEPLNPDDDSARGDQLQRDMATANKSDEAACSPPMGEEAGEDGWRDGAELASGLRFQSCDDFAR
jgi:hypothetical protein